MDFLGCKKKRFEIVSFFSIDHSDIFDHKYVSDILKSK